MGQEKFDVVVIGAGAAGLFCAGVAAGRGRSVLVVDHAAKPGEKIRISGGGRCNFTNLGTVPARFISKNPHFCKSALARYTQHDFIALVDRYRIAWHEKTLGQLFCDGSSQQIIDMLMAEARDCTLMMDTKVSAVQKADDRGFDIVTSRGNFSCTSLVIATGGLSIPKIGATGFAYDIARQFGLGVIDPVPALVPLTFTDDILNMARDLSGVGIDPVVARCGATQFREAILFTHRGLSGPAILQVSSYWSPGEDLDLDLAPDVDVFSVLRERRTSSPRRQIQTVLSDIVPQRLAEKIVGRSGAGGQIADFSDARLRAIAAHLQGWRVRPNGSEGFRTAEVTKGGVDTAGLSSQTFEARGVPGLYFIGEAVDVTGWLGGYNFQWAWSSGWCAGQAV